MAEKLQSLSIYNDQVAMTVRRNWIAAGIPYCRKTSIKRLMTQGSGVTT